MGDSIIPCEGYLAAACAALCMPSCGLRSVAVRASWLAGSAIGPASTAACTGVGDAAGAQPAVVGDELGDDAGAGSANPSAGSGGGAAAMISAEAASYTLRRVLGLPVTQSSYTDVLEDVRARAWP